MADAEAALARAHVDRARFVHDLERFTAFPTVGAQPGCAGAMRQAAAWLARCLARYGLEHARVIPTPGQPVVYADWLHAPGRPTVLVYGHYDVQPADPVDAWQSPPFAPTHRGDRLYARGITDDKGQLMVHMAALTSYLRANHRLPVNARVVVEGEEETGSQHFGQFVERSRPILASDVAVVSDTPMLGPDRPALTYSLRGALSLDLEVVGQQHDLHSGLFGGAILNPLQALCDTLASFHAADGRIGVDGFYDQVREWDLRERSYMAATGPSDGEILRSAGGHASWGEAGYTAYERTTIRPSLSITGVRGGYAGPGSKAVIPSRAVGKLNLRLVPDQEPGVVLDRLAAHVSRVTPRSVRSSIRNAVGVPPVLVDRFHPFTRAAHIACARAFGADPAYIRIGGTIAAVAEIQRRLQTPVVLMGFALPDARLHAPNENLHLPTFFRAIDAAILFLSQVRVVRPLRGLVYTDAVVGSARR